MFGVVGDGIIRSNQGSYVGPLDNTFPTQWIQSGAVLTPAYPQQPAVANRLTYVGGEEGMSISFSRADGENIEANDNFISGLRLTISILGFSWSQLVPSVASRLSGRGFLTMRVPMDIIPRWRQSFDDETYAVGQEYTLRFEEFAADPIG